MKLIRHTELIVLYMTIAFFFIIAFKQPRIIYFENTDYERLYKEAEAINYLFRTIVLLIIPIILIWRLIRPNDALRIISMIIVLITFIILILDFNGIVDYYRIFAIKNY